MNKNRTLTSIQEKNENQMKTNEKQPEAIQPLRLYNMKEFEALTGVSRWKLYDLITAGIIKPVVNMGKGYKFTGDELKPEHLERL